MSRERERDFKKQEKPTSKEYFDVFCIIVALILRQIESINSRSIYPTDEVLCRRVYVDSLRVLEVQMPEYDLPFPNSEAS